MPPKIRQLKASLRRAGAIQVSQKGSHMKWKHHLIPAKTLTLSGHDGDDVKPYQEKDVREFIQLIALKQRRSSYE